MGNRTIPAFTRLWLILLCLGFFHLGVACVALGDAYSAGAPLFGPLLQIALVGVYTGYAMMCVARALRVSVATPPAT